MKVEDFNTQKLRVVTRRLDSIGIKNSRIECNRKESQEQKAVNRENVSPVVVEDKARNVNAILVDHLAMPSRNRRL